MSKMEVNQSDEAGDSMPRPRRRRHLRLMLVVALSVALALLIGQFFILPMLLREQIENALHESGIDAVRFRVARATLWGAELADIGAGEGSAVHIDHIALDYSLGDLRRGRLNAIRILGATVRLGMRDGRFDFTPLQSLVSQRRESATTLPANATAQIPVQRIELEDSKLILMTPKAPVNVPLGGSLVPHSDGRLSVSLQIGEERAFVLGAELKGQQLTFAGSADPGRTLLTVRAIWPDADVSADGKLKLSGTLNWEDQPATGQARLEILGDSGTVAPGDVRNAKLHLSAGVFEVAARFGGSSDSPPLRLNVNKASIAMADQGFSASGITGQVNLLSFSPLRTPPEQTFVADSLKIGSLDFTHGTIDFQMSSQTQMSVKHTQWAWLGGSVWADNFTISNQPLAITLHAKDVELAGVLALTAQGKASGQGKISGDIPVTIEGSNVQFGTGQLAAASGGNVQIKDMEAISPTAEAAAQSVEAASSEQIKKNVIEALSDFQYDTLSMSLEKTPQGGLIGHVHMKGHGRTGAKQPIDYELNVTGLDKLLRGYLRIREELNAPHPTTTTTGKAQSP